MGTGRLSRVGAALRRAREHSGYERDTVLLVLKSVIAASVAWVVAYNVLDLTSPAFAPFTAVSMLQATVYRAVRQSLQYVAAVILGVLIEAGLGFGLGPGIATFVLLALAALLIGRWRRLENQGSQVATAAFFAYSTFVLATSDGQRLRELGGIVVLVVIGAACAVVTNLAWPPLRYRGVEHGIARLTASLGDLLGDMAAILSRSAPAPDEADDWLYRAGRFDEAVVQVRQGVTHAEESVRWNPRLLLGAHPSTFTGYRAALDAFDRAGERIRAIAEAMSRLRDADQDESDADHTRFLAAYGELLDVAKNAVYDLGYIDELRNYGEVDSLTEHIRQGRRHYERLADQVGREELDAAGQWPLYGGLLIDGDRLVEEFETARQQLAGDTDRRTRV